MPLSTGVGRSIAMAVSRTIAGLQGEGLSILGTLSVTTQTPVAGANVTFTISVTSVHGELAVDDDTPTSGGSITFTWSESLEYQWLVDGSDILGATNSTLAITNWDDTDNGDYSVLVTDTRTGASRVFGPLTVGTVYGFLRPSGVDTYLRPDGTSEYRRAA